MVKPITGSFFEFEHPNRAERVYTHDIQCAFTEEQWRAKVRETHALGMDTLILLSTAWQYQAYFPFDGYPYPSHLACKNVLDVFMDEANKTGQRVFLGVGFYGTSDSVGNSTNPDIVATALRAMNTLYARYGQYACLEGWYIADEWCIWDHFDERFITYINTVTAESKSLDKRLKVMLAPFGTHCLQADDVFVEQLSRIDADIIAYQDEVGVKRLTVDRLEERFEALRKAHDQAGRSALWVDTETFTFEGDVYRSALLPAPFERIDAQLKALSPYVDKIVMYTYQGVFEQPNSIARVGNDDAVRLFEAYTKQYR